jgi:hypothetical protein
MTWLVLLDGSPSDVAHVKRLFTSSHFVFDEIDGKSALNAPAFALCCNKDDAIDTAMELAATINTALRLSVAEYTGLGFWGIVEKRDDGTMHRTVFAKGRVFRIAGGPAAIGKPIRTREERLVTLLQRNDEVADVAVGLTPYPLTWGAMSKTYESVVGLMSTKANPSARRSDYEGLVDRGWLTRDESEAFYHTAAYHRHGYPKTPVRGGKVMDHEDALNLVKRLFWLLVDELEPT